jgi:hypothetical protein
MCLTAKKYGTHWFLIQTPFSFSAIARQEVEIDFGGRNLSLGGN